MNLISIRLARKTGGRRPPKTLYGSKVVWQKCVANSGALCSSPRGSTKSRALTSGLRYKRELSVGLAARYKVVGRRQLTVSCVAICVAVGEKLRIGERGVKLSGGQKQRLAIARLILHNPQVIILDEATSALDSIVESEILDNLSELFGDRTMIVISHKPLVNFKKDETYLVENKCIVKTA